MTEKQIKKSNANNEELCEIKSSNHVTLGHVYVMTHSLFSDIIKIGCTPEDPIIYAKALSAKTIGEYSVVFSLYCNTPCEVTQKIKHYLAAEEYTKGFYQVPPDVAAKLFKRETLKIPEIYPSLLKM